MELVVCCRWFLSIAAPENALSLLYAGDSISRNWLVMPHTTIICTIVFNDGSDGIAAIRELLGPVHD